MPYVLNGEAGQIEITSGGVRHRIELSVDRMHQQPVLVHNQTEIGQTVGTHVFVRWPNDPSRADEYGRNSEECAEFDEDDELGDVEEEHEVYGSDSACSILAASKSRFLQIAGDFTILKPHLALTVNSHGQKFELEPSDTASRKWLPSNPTSAHWYADTHFERLVAGYVAHDQERGRDRTVRELVAEFDGLTSTGKQKAVLEATGLARQPLSAMVNGDGRDLDRQRLAGLRSAMKELTKPVKPTRLGPIGKDHIRRRFEQLGGEMEFFQYKKVHGFLEDVPWIAETAFVWCPKASGRRLVTGVNWLPGIVNPFRELGRWGESMDSVLSQQRVDRDERVIFLLHLMCPRVEYTDRGKSAGVVPG
jgi:hypothetical protein